MEKELRLVGTDADRWQSEDHAIELVSRDALESLTRAEVDMQIATAKRFPRNIRRAKDDAIAMATMDEETAESCFYSIPRAGKTIQGPSVRAAEIVVSTWGNIRAGSRVVSHDAKTIKAQAFCHDMEKNVCITVEKDRRITNKQGKTFDDDMVVVTGNAAASIALRDAVFKTIPRTLVQAVYNAARECVAGSTKPMSERRDRALRALASIGVHQPQVCAYCKVQSTDELNGEHLADLFGVFNAIKEGETTVDAVFPKVSDMEQQQPETKTDAKGTSQPSQAASGKAGADGGKKESVHIRDDEQGGKEQAQAAPQDSNDEKPLTLADVAEALDVPPGVVRAYTQAIGLHRGSFSGVSNEARQELLADIEKTRAAISEWQDSQDADEQPPAGDQLMAALTKAGITAEDAVAHLRRLSWLAPDAGLDALQDVHRQQVIEHVAEFKQAIDKARE